MVQQNHLDHEAEFLRVLENYQIAPEGQRVLADVRLVLLIGPTASGRDTIIREVLKTGQYTHVISDTTRLPRVNDGVKERSGVEYWFRSEADFLQDLKAGKYLEAEIMFHQQISGISVRELRKAQQQQRIAISDMDLSIRNILPVKPDAVAVLVVPPTFEEWMDRLAGRGAMQPAEKHRRLKTACRILRAGLEWDFFTYVVNQTVPEAAAVLHRRVMSGQPDPVEQARGRQVIKKLLHDTEAYLDSWQS